MVKKWVQGKGFYLQPLNSFGEPEGKPMVENPENVSMLPLDVDLGEGVQEVRYTLAAESAQLTPKAKKARTAQVRERMVTCYVHI